MYIPLKALQSKKCIQSEELSTHQSIAKALHKYSNKKPKPKRIKDNGENTKSFIIYQTQLQKDVYQWFFSLDINSRIKICSIHNRWYINLLHQLSLLYFYRPNSHFQMKDIDCVNSNNNEASDLNYYSTLFKVFETTIVAMSQSRNELIAIDSDFYNQIQYTNLNSLNDAVSLKKTFLANQEKLMYCFSKLSPSNFSQWIDTEYNEEKKLYNFAKPQWLENSQSVSLSKLFLSLFEQVIQINYQYYFHIKKLYENPYHIKYDELFESNDNIKQFLMKNDFKHIIEEMNVTDLLKAIKSDPAIVIEINKQGELNNKVMEITNRKNSYLADKILEEGFIKHIIEQLKSMESISEFINALTWFSFNSILQYANIVIWGICKHVKNKYNNSIALDLIVEELMSNTNAKPKTKKKSKKKKKKKSDNQSLTTTEENKDIESSKNNIAGHQNETIDSKPQNGIVVIDNNIKQSNIEEVNEKENNNENLNIENNKGLDTNDDNDHQKKKRQKKKQGIHLYKIPEKKVKQQSNKEPKEVNEENNNTKLLKKQTKVNIEITDSSKSTISSSNISIIQSSINQPNDKLNKNSIISNETYQHHSNQVYNDQLLPYFQHQPIFISNNYYCYYNNNSSSNPMQRYPSTDLFYAMLSYDITSFSSLVNRNLALIRDDKNKQRDKLNSIIRSALISKYDTELIYFGSYVTNLSIENSDIDILVKYNPKSKDQNEPNSIDTIINELINAFNNDKESFESINPIYTANVPIIKLRCYLSSESNEKIKKTLTEGYQFDINELFRVKFDITFFETNAVADKCPLQEIVEYVNNAIIEYPDIRPIMYVLKRFLQSGELNSAYKGN